MFIFSLPSEQLKALVILSVCMIFVNINILVCLGGALASIKLPGPQA